MCWGRLKYGYRPGLVRWIEERGLEALAVDTRFDADRDETGAGPQSER